MFDFKAIKNKWMNSISWIKMERERLIHIEYVFDVDNVTIKHDLNIG